MTEIRKHIEKAPIKPVVFYPDERLANEMRGISKDDYASVPKTIKRNFWKHTPLGRTLTLRNSTGKTIAGIITGAIGAYTGIELNIIPKQTIDPMFLLLESFSLETLFADPLSAILTIAVILISVFTAYLVRKGWLNKVTIDKIKEVLNDLKKAKHENSPGGKNLTEGELASLQHKTLSAIEEALDHHGIDIDLDGDGK